LGAHIVEKSWALKVSDLLTRTIEDDSEIEVEVLSTNNISTGRKLPGTGLDCTGILKLIRKPGSGTQRYVEDLVLSILSGIRSLKIESVQEPCIKPNLYLRHVSRTDLTVSKLLLGNARRRYVKGLVLRTEWRP